MFLLLLLLLPFAHEGHLFEIAFESLVLSVLADVGGDEHQNGAGVEYDNDHHIAQSAHTVVLVT